MTEKIYEKDSYIKEFNAKVVSCESAGDNFEIILDRTAFFPEEGGQSADTGFIGEVRVDGVKLRGEDIVHVCNEPLEVGKEYFCVIDFEDRYVKMQNHTGEHIVSGIIKREYGFDNVGFHLGKDSVTLDVNGVLKKEDIDRIENLSNQVVYANKKITATYPTILEQEKLEFRSKISLRENLRLIEIENTDLCACCAPHVGKTGEVGMIKITDFSSHRGGTRITMYSGELARAHYEKTYSLLSKLLKSLSGNYDNAEEKLNIIKEELVLQKSENKMVRSKLLLTSLKLSEVGGLTVAFTENADFDEIRFCVNSLLEEKNAVLIISHTNGANMYMLASKDDKAKEVFDNMRLKLTVRGGFKNNFSQGKIENNREEIEGFLV